MLTVFQESSHKYNLIPSQKSQKRVQGRYKSFLLNVQYNLNDLNGLTILHFLRANIAKELLTTLFTQIKLYYHKIKKKII